MKYLRRFNESIDNQLEEDCKYILSELSDKGVIVIVNNNKIGLYIELESRTNSDNDYIKLKEYKLDFEHLLSFLKSNGYVLQKDSYVTNDTWDPIERCPNCGYVNTMINPKINFHDETAECGACEYKSNMYEFLEHEHKIDEKELNYYINQNYWVSGMYLYFKGSKDI